MPFVVAAEEKAELACTFAALVLHDEKLPISAENIAKLLTAANVGGVEPYWPKMFADMLAGKDVGNLLASGAAPSGGGGGGAAPAAADAKDDKKGGKDDKKGGKDDKGGKGADKGGKKEKEKPKEEEPEEDGGGIGGFSLFD